ncbi:YbhB/YbcL family Raf kinase inhibitor-like protein [Thermococcus sp. MV5]|uniref:YbhB/YbcL family Raf kinase inhibitor-like protein n=1 Tax=Thermococcus sp. MV5 TaxID=1638272 RepID=UPI00143AC3E5|nr:YbhB/YbcL family Raf kinase inhibitor-like protein [Thermococcus sp. MV5]NJE26371.1 YbhB/YbcL family Raf kinase inhibitor-like protein [Thermococcus sp. MV5]
MKTLGCLIVLFVFAVGCLGGGEKVSLKVSSVFGENELIPSKYTCEGIDVSPPLHLEGLSDKAVSIAIIVDDPDAPIGTFTHWVAWNIPPVAEIPEGVPKERVVESPIKAFQGKNDFGRIGYNGPCPPRGHGVHHYHFKIYVLDTTLDLKPGATKKELEKAIQGHVIQFGELVGLYERH